MRILVGVLAATLAAVPLAAQLTQEQKVFEFQALAGVYAKRYGPANWKIQALGVNIFELRPWMDRVRASKSDLEFFEICAEFVASLQDGHSSHSMRSLFAADLGLFVDLYDGKPLIESINRTRYPAAQFPFEIGDELVSIDGQAAETILAGLTRLTGYGNALGARRMAADALVFRSQSRFPRAVELPDQSDVAIRRASTGTVETFRLTWLKTGAPILSVPPVPSPSFASASNRTAAGLDYMETLNELRNWKYDSDVIRDINQRVIDDGEGGQTTRGYILGWGSRAPYYNPPAGFAIRRGQSAADTFFTGTFMASGKRVGLLRIPNFAPGSGFLALRELDAEIAFFKANTDGLIVDISRNTGGGCIGIDYAQRLMTQPFYAFTEHLRPTLQLIAQVSNSLRLARAQRAEQWVINIYESFLTELQASAKENRAMTGPIAVCGTSSESFPAPGSMFEPLRGPDGTLAAYDKPLIVLVDELSISFGDIFPGMMQDAKRGPIVGMRTAGAGGSVTGWSYGTYSESFTSATNSLVIRARPIQAPNLPVAPYIENIGILPDVEVNYMTRENLMARGRPYMDAVTNVLLTEIAKTAP
ncbi:MAG: hypothetical protein FJW30_03605 [Acidobacteria bacterium]|nr:hypothetical protein [Acidobacteriota bacterium]